MFYMRLCCIKIHCNRAMVGEKTIQNYTLLSSKTSIFSAVSGGGVESCRAKSEANFALNAISLLYLFDFIVLLRVARS